MNKHLKCWAAAGLMALFLGTAAAVPQAMFQKSSIVAEAADTVKDYKIGKLIYTVNETKGTAVVKGLNREYASNGIIDSVEIPATVTYITEKTANVIKIGDGAFKSDRYLRTVDLSKATKLTAIGQEAFYSLSVSTITIPNTVKTIGIDSFSNCTNLSTITLSSALTSIPEGAFCRCRKLQTITIPATVTSIGTDAFRLCDVLNKVTFASGSKLKTIGDHAFRYDEKLASISLPASVTSIGIFAFAGCNALTSFTIPSTSKLSSIGERAFENCMFTGITLPAALETIGTGAFRSCDNLKTITFRSVSKLKTVGDDAFYECPLLSGIAIPASVTTIGSNAFYKCTSITSITIPDSVTTIGDHAFDRMDKLTTVSIGKGVTSIADTALAGTKALKTITVTTGNTAYLIYNRALYTKDYSKLIKYPSANTKTSFKAHSKTKYVALGAFSDTVKLNKVDFSATSGMVFTGSNFGTDCKSVTQLVIPDSENKSSNGSNVLKKYDSLFRNKGLTTLNGSPLVNNLDDSSKAPTFHSTIADVMYNVFEDYNDELFMDQYLDAYAKYAVNDAYSKYGQKINPRADIANLSQLEKAYAIYQWVHNQAAYDSEEFSYGKDENGNTIVINEKSDRKNHCDASVFLHKKSDGKFYTVCDGYARAYNLVMKAAGIECYYIDSGNYKLYNKYVSHAFNSVKIGSNYYIADTTSGTEKKFLISANQYKACQGTFSDVEYWTFKQLSSRHITIPNEKPSKLAKNTFADLNADDSITGVDFAPLQMCLVKRITLTTRQRSLADVNSDGSVNYLDADLMKAYLKNIKGVRQFYRMCDVTMDGFLSKADATLLQKYLLGSADLTVEQAVLADINNDGKLNGTDLSLLKSLLLYQLGDVNRDGKVDKTDKQLLLKHIAGITTLSNDVLWYADYNGDGSIDVSDAVAICVDYNITD